MPLSNCLQLTIDVSLAIIELLSLAVKQEALRAKIGRSRRFKQVCHFGSSILGEKRQWSLVLKVSEN